MSVFDSFLNMMQLSTDDEDEDDDINRGYEDEEPAKKPNKRREPDPVRTVADHEKERKTESRQAFPAKSAGPQGRIAPVRTSPIARRAVDQSGQVSVYIMKPKVFEDGREASDILKEGNPVFISLEDVEFELKQRLVDFISGSCYALDGSLQRISTNNFLFAPKNVPITGINFDGIDEFDGIRSEF